VVTYNLIHEPAVANTQHLTSDHQYNFHT